MSATVYVSRGRRRRRHAMVASALLVAGITSWQAADALAPGPSSTGLGGGGWAGVAWPAQGAAAGAVGGGRVHTAGSKQPVPVAIPAEGMTALGDARRRRPAAHCTGRPVTSP